MKRLYYTTVEKPRRTYGGMNVTAQVYTIRKGELVHVCETKWCTASYPGEDTAIMRAAIEAGAIPTSYANDEKGFPAYYFNGTHGDKLKITRI